MSVEAIGGTPLAGIVGHRSWIAQALMGQLRSDGVMCSTYDKLGVDLYDFSRIDCLYLFAGRARGTHNDERAEIELVERLRRLPRERWPRSLAYVSSTAVHARPLTTYGACKFACEAGLIETFGDILIVLRPPALFGPGQLRDSGMLIPSLVREGEDVVLREPDVERDFCAVEDFVWEAARLVKARPGARRPHFVVSFRSLRATPRQLQRLWRTFSELADV